MVWCSVCRNKNLLFPSKDAAAAGQSLFIYLSEGGGSLG